MVGEKLNFMTSLNSKYKAISEDTSCSKLTFFGFGPKQMSTS